MKLILMTQPDYFIEEDKIITALFDEGLDILHINKPASEPLYAERLLTLVPKTYRNQIVVHQHYYLKNEFDLRGIHINDPGEPTPDGFRRHITRSTQRIDMVKEMKRGCDYVFLHSLYDSIHGDERASLYYEDIAEASRRGIIDKKVYAMGGISTDNIREVRDVGFGGAVVCGDIWTRFDRHHDADFRTVIEHFRRLRSLAN